MASMTKILEEKKGPWRNIRGLAAACIVTLGRIGWDIPQHQGWKIWIDRRSELIDITKTPPHELKKRIHKDIATSYWTRSMLNESINDDQGIWFEPLRSAALDKDH